MKHNFRVALPDGAHYDAAFDENLLRAAQRAQWLVRYGCRNGNCDACAAQLLEGRVQHADGCVIAAPAAKILLCLCQARSDLRIALADDPRPGSFDQSLRCYALLQQQTISERESVLNFTLPAGRKPQPLAGQVALIETASGLLQAHIDHDNSRGRTLIAKLIFASPLQQGAYYHVRYPLSATQWQKEHGD